MQRQDLRQNQTLALHESIIAKSKKLLFYLCPKIMAMGFIPKSPLEF